MEGCTLRGDGKGGQLREGARDVGIGDVGTGDVCSCFLYISR